MTRADIGPLGAVLVLAGFLVLGIICDKVNDDRKCATLFRNAHTAHDSLVIVSADPYCTHRMEP